MKNQRGSDEETVKTIGITVNLHLKNCYWAISIMQNIWENNLNKK